MDILKTARRYTWR